MRQLELQTKETLHIHLLEGIKLPKATCVIYEHHRRGWWRMLLDRVADRHRTALSYHDIFVRKKAT